MKKAGTPAAGVGASALLTGFHRWLSRRNSIVRGYLKFIDSKLWLTAATTDNSDNRQRRRTLILICLTALFLILFFLII